MKLKKMGTLIACGALVTVIGAVSVSASGSFTTLQVKAENGVRHYSTDDGKTWSTETPEGVTETTDENGKVTITRGKAPAEGESGTQESVAEGRLEVSGVNSLLVKVENGVKQYSTDGGKTWSQQPPK